MEDKNFRCFLYIQKTHSQRSSLVLKEVLEKLYMSYVIKKDTHYCYVDSKSKVCKTESIRSVKKFDTKEKAYALLHRASKKLKGYKIIELDTTMQQESQKTKRKQVPQGQRIEIYNKYKGRCAICGKFVSYDDFTIDHMVPLSKGGTNEMDNLQLACNVCNRIKQDILPEDFMKKLTEIILYQMRKSYDNRLWKRMNYLRRLEKKRKMKKIIAALLRKF